VALTDGSLGFPVASPKILPETGEQRCWVHNTANMFKNQPKSVQPKARSDLYDIWQVGTHEGGSKASDHFL